MTTTRILPGVMLALAATAAPAVAQYGYDADGPPARSAGSPTDRVPPPEFDMPYGRPPAAAGPNPVERLSAPVRPASGAAADPYATLTGQPAAPPGGPLPPGAYPSPYYTDGPGCCGPLGANGRVGYEIYSVVGVNLPYGPGLGGLLNAGVMTGGGGRSLFFNPAHDAAWVFDMGVTYTYNTGKQDRPQGLFLKQAPITFGQQTFPQPDRFATTVVRGFHRTSFNFALGRDWWRWGPGAVGTEAGWNARCGGFVGGRWGTAHVDMRPVDEPNGYSRRQGVFHGVYLGTHATVEVPMGAWIGFIGGRAEWGYDWSNLVIPIPGDIQNVNLLLTAGVRF